MASRGIGAKTIGGSLRDAVGAYALALCLSALSGAAAPCPASWDQRSRRGREALRVIEIVSMPPSCSLMPLRDGLGSATLFGIGVPHSPCQAKGEWGTLNVGGG